jgi:hypothetical protein
MNGVLVVSQAYHGLNESAPFNMIGASVKSHFSLIDTVISLEPGMSGGAIHAAVQYICNISGSGPATLPR